MPGFEIALGFRNQVSTSRAIPAGGGVAHIAPSSAWNGTAGSGFDVVPGAPLRMTASPACRLLTPPWQWFADSEIVGVVAAANDSGSLLQNLGLDKVIVHYEGSSVEIAAPSIRTLTDANGNARDYLGWWVELRHDGRHGFADLYFEAVPRDATMQHRVIGPYRYAPQPARYTHQIEVAATPSEVIGQRYKSLAAAVGFLRGLPGPINPLVTITEDIPDGNFDGHQFGFTAATLNDGWLHVTASVPVTFSKSGTRSFFWILSNSMHLLGSNITFDFRDMAELSFASGWPGHGNWFDGINLVNSNGPFDLFEKRTRNSLAQLIRSPLDDRRHWYTECTFDSVFNPANFAHLIRGNLLVDCWADLFNNSHAVIGNTVENWQNHGYRDPLDAMTVSYVGTQPTASIEISQPALFNNRVVTARWGASSATFTLENTSAAFAAGTNYTVGNLVDWINTTLAGQDSGWQATLLDDSRYAVAIVKNALDLASAFPLTSVKDSVLTLRTAFDVHGDWMQQQNTAGSTPFENVYVEGNRGFGLEGQIFLLGGNSSTRDFIAINNAWSMRDSSLALGISTQFSRPQSHVVYAHNTLLDQNLLLRMDIAGSFDSFCMIASNALTDIDWIGTPDPDLLLKDNHLQAIGEAPAGAVGTTIGGSKASLAVDAINGDFSPAGDLLTQLKPAVAVRDLQRAVRGSTAPAGALR